MYVHCLGIPQWLIDLLQQKAQDKADAMVKLLGYPDWLQSPAELDKYFDGVITLQIKIFGPLRYSVML